MTFKSFDPSNIQATLQQVTNKGQERDNMAHAN